MIDPVNPAHYAGRACADIGERLSANGYQVLKYVWRLGKKDAPLVELGKALWYARSERALLETFNARFPGMRAQALTHDLEDPDAFLADRIGDQPMFTRTIAYRLWAGYEVTGVDRLIALLDAERANYALTGT